MPKNFDDMGLIEMAKTLGDMGKEFKYCPMKMKCLDGFPTCASCKKLFRVDIVQEDGFGWEHVPQGYFDSKEEAFSLRNELVEKGFEYVSIHHNNKPAVSDSKEHEGGAPIMPWVDKR